MIIPTKPASESTPTAAVEAPGKFAIPQQPTPAVVPYNPRLGFIERPEGCSTPGFSPDGNAWTAPPWNALGTAKCGADKEGEYLRFNGGQYIIEIRGASLFGVFKAYVCQTLLFVSPSSPAGRSEKAKPFIKSVEICEVEEDEEN